MAKVTKKSKSPSTKKEATSVSSRVSSSSSKSSNKNTLLVATLILVVFQLIILFGLVFSFESKLGTAVEKIESIDTKVSAIDNFFASNVDGYGSGSPSGNGGSANTGEPLEVDIEGEPMIGNPDATVTVVEFSDYECPFCARWHSESYNLLKTEYIDTGKIKFVYKDFPLNFHPSAKLSAIAANCVFDQLGGEAYFTYHSTLFENQRQFSTQAQLTQWSTDLKIWALDLGVDSSAYDTCTSDPAQAAEVDADLAEGAALGVSGTPSFLINGNLIVGAQPYSVIKQAIEAELNK
jgi:protein-disulfide isomerase